MYKCHVPRPRTLWNEFLTNILCKIIYFTIKLLSFQTKNVFLVGAFSLKEKSPTLTVSSFFFFLFFSVDNLTLSGPLFLQFCNSAQKANFTPTLSVFTFSRKHTQPDVPKGSPLWIFFGILRLKKYFFSKKNFKNNFFEKFFFQIFTIVVP